MLFKRCAARYNLLLLLFPLSLDLIRASRIDLRQLWVCSNVVRPHENISSACRPECVCVRMSPSLWVMSMERQVPSVRVCVCVGSHVIVPKMKSLRERERESVRALSCIGPIVHRAWRVVTWRVDSLSLLALGMAIWNATENETALGLSSF